MPAPGTSTADFLRPADDDDGEEEIEVPVLEENWDTVRAFGQCQPTWIVGLAGASYGGIPATEIEAACRLLQIPPPAWPEVGEGIRIMALTSAEAYRNKR